MPISFEIDKEAGIVYTTIQGSVSTEEVIEGLTRIIHHQDFRPGLNGLADLRESEYETFTKDVRQLADLMIKYSDKIGPSKTAIVVSKDLTYGMTRMYQTFAEGSSIETMIFKDIEEARQWLGIESRAQK